MTSVTTTSSTSITDLMSTMNVKTVSTSTDTVDADTNKFMTLLVTQLKNQDPMNPLDNAQLTSQLAQLSTVTGVNKPQHDAGIAENQLPSRRKRCRLPT